MASRFAGFPPEMMKFFRDLDRNNNREWFQDHKSVYEEKVKAPMTELVERVNAELAKFAPDHINEPKKAIYRIYRDTRFSKDKTPYKTHVGAIFPRRGLEKHSCGSYYFHVSPKEFLIAGGAYMPGKDELFTLRTHLAGRAGECRKLAGAKKLRSLMGELRGEQLARTPKGFPSDHPDAGLLRNKQWYFYTDLEPKLATTPDLEKELLKRFRVMQPFIDFLNAPLVARKRDTQPDPRSTFPMPSARR